MLMMPFTEEAQAAPPEAVKVPAFANLPVYNAHAQPQKPHDMFKPFSGSPEPAQCGREPDGPLTLVFLHESVIVTLLAYHRH